MLRQLELVLSKFKYDGESYSCDIYGNGHINTTYKVECKQGDKTARYILQRINNNIFPDTNALMDNIENVTAFLKDKITERAGDILRETLNIVPTVDGKNYFTDENGDNWRSYIFIENTV